LTTHAQPIDLRSDTVTRPTPAMREAMARAEVGDDQFGEDPTINLLQERAAHVLGKEAVLWIPTGTMANQIALRVLTRPGDEVIVSRESHAAWHETGGGGANAGIQFSEIGGRGGFTADEFVAAIKPRGHMLYPPTTLVEVENTHNRAGGVVIPQDEVERICAAAKKHSIATFLDGARIWNAAIATGLNPAHLAKPFDMVAASLSKGLGAPGGALLGGSKEHIKAAVRHRRMLGGAMRQAGIFGAAGIYGIEHNYERLAEDHAHARIIAERLVQSPKVVLDLNTVKTNILCFDLPPGAPDGATVVARAKERGVLVIAFGVRMIRVVTHLDVTREQCERAAEILAEVVEK